MDAKPERSNRQGCIRADSQEDTEGTEIEFTTETQITERGGAATTNGWRRCIGVSA
jgi:hypothetical protein